MDITPHIPPVALTTTSPRVDGPAFEVWSVDYSTKFGVVYRSGGMWIAAANIEFPSLFQTRDDAIAILAMFRGEFPIPDNPDETLDDVDTTTAPQLNELRFPRQVLDRADPLHVHDPTDNHCDDRRVVFTVVHAAPTWFALDEEALAKWVDEHHDELDGAVPNEMHEAPGNAVSDLVSDAVEAGALVTDPDLELQVNGDDDSDGSGFYVILHNRHGRQRMIGLTTGWTEFHFPDKHLPLIDGIRHCLEQVVSAANNLLIIVAGRS